ncbi:MAG: hypothetical protein RL095_2282 [Verrucomicrobiota bacterium]|jgi:lipopolysaccharide transport protein LptA
MNCLDEERLILLAEGLEPEPAEAAHLARCPACGAALQNFREANALVEEFLPPAPAAEVDDGLAFGPYSGCREIACGAMSRVYRGRDPEGRAVAVKVCRDSSLLDSFGNEVKMLQRCAAAGVPGVVPLVDARLDHLPAFIVTPYFPRGTLGRLLQEGRVDAELVLGVAAGLSRSLAVLAELGIVHGDLKASNILLDESGRPCLADLGGARRVAAPGQSSTLSHAGPGHMSLVSMSPEQARGQDLSPASDVFSLGVILYQAATGRHPFAGGTSWEMASRILTENPADPRPLLEPRYPPRFAERLEACLAKDPASRPAAAELAEEFCKNPEKPVNPPLSPASLVEPRAQSRNQPRKILMTTLIAIPLAAALLHFAAPAEAAKPQEAANKSSSQSQSSSSSISSRTENGQTTITFNGQEVWKGATTGKVRAQTLSREGQSFAAAFDGDQVLWESSKGAGAEIEKDLRHQEALKAEIEAKLKKTQTELKQAQENLKSPKISPQQPPSAPLAPSEPEVIPVNIKAVNGRYDAKSGATEFAGSVHVDDGTMSLDCDRMTAYFIDQKPDAPSAGKVKYTEPASGKALHRVVCEKNVVIRKGDQRATAERAEYFFEEGKIVLTGNPILKHKRSTVKGSRITYYRDFETCSVENLDANGQDLQPRKP